MFERFRRNRADDQWRDSDQAGVATAERERLDEPRADMPPVEEDRAEPMTRTRPAGLVTGEAVLEARRRQRAEFGGFNWGTAFFGWLVAVGLAAILVGLLSAAGGEIGLTEISGSGGQSEETVSLVGGIVLVAILVAAYAAGGYVAGRMSRFDGARQGLGVWVFGLLVTIALAALAAIAGAEYNVLEKLELPRIPIDEGDLTTGGIVALAAVVIGTLVAAMAGGKVGERYHRRVDRAAIVE